MSAFIYDLALQAYLTGGFNMSSDTIKCLAVQISGAGTPYTANQVTDQFVSIIPSGAIASRTAALTSPTVTNGIFGAADTVFNSVTFANAIGAIVLYKDTGLDSTSPLIAYIDSTICSGLPLTPSPGSNITLSFSPTGNKIFSL